MDQSVIAGIGNIYRTEILWRQKVHPSMRGKLLDRISFDRIWSEAVKLLQLGVKHNAIITVDNTAKSASRYGERVNIFAKQPALHATRKSANLKWQQGAFSAATHAKCCQKFKSRVELLWPSTKSYNPNRLIVSSATSSNLVAGPPLY